LKPSVVVTALSCAAVARSAPAATSFQTPSVIATPSSAPPTVAATSRARRGWRRQSPIASTRSAAGISP
jgi:hypothetical protein